VLSGNPCRRIGVAAHAKWPHENAAEANHFFENAD
jgi:hypothetical protein